MGSMRAALAKHWKLGAVTFLIVSSLCGVSISTRQTRHNLVFSFSVHTISHEIRLPSLAAINPENIVNQMRLSLEDRSLHGSISHHEGAFAVIVDSIPADSTDHVERELSTIYQQLIERLAKDIDPAPLSGQLDLLDARLNLIVRSLQATELSAYERYGLEDQALSLRAQREHIRSQVDVLSSVFGKPTSQLYRAEQMDSGVLLLLSVTLSGFIACAAVVLADSFAGQT